MKTRSLTLIAPTLALLCAGTFMSGCDKSNPGTASSAGGTPSAAAVAAILPAGFFLEAPPAGAKTVEEAKAAAQVGQPIILQGRIGGSVAPFVEDRAVFTLMGPGLKSCSDNPGDECPTPWDYCCEKKADIAEHAATIQVADAGGKPLKLSLKNQHGIKELSELIIVGTVSQKDDKVLVVNATAVYAKP